MVVRINQVSDFICHNTKIADECKNALKHKSNPIQQNVEYTRCMPEVLSKVYIKDRALEKTVSSLPKTEKPEILFERQGYFNKNNYIRSFEKRQQDMKEGLYCVSDKTLSEQIKSTGDLYSFEEISQIEEMVNAGIPVKDAIRCRGREDLLQILEGNVKLESEATIKHMVEEYVNKLAVFKEKDKGNFYENTKKINKFIKSKTEYIHDPVLYRGEQSETEIHRLLSLALEKQHNPNKTVKYTPDHLFSTTNDLNVLTSDYDYADKCLIKIVGTDGKCKGIDVNQMIGSKNKFFTQKEILLPSTCEFEVLDGVIENDRLVITLKYLH